MQWVQSVVQHTQTFSLHNLKSNIYSYIKNISILYLRYIDDIFMIWTRTKPELLVLLENLNSEHKTIKFEHNISHSKISFLTHWYIKTRTTLFRQLSVEIPLIRNPISMHIQTIQSHLREAYLKAKLWGSKPFVPPSPNIKNTVLTETKLHRKRIRRKHLERWIR